jgi:cation diffusion facilitator CzcD-associated flavoprotein CzcO
MTQQHVDVLIVGAGISGIGGACHLRQSCPDKSFVILEGRDAFGGTWDLFRFPGIRSDSDLYTYGYKFKPWQGKPIATAPEILNYLGATIDAFELEDQIRYRHRVQRVEWSSQSACWTVQVQHQGETHRFTCSFLWMCQGYYNDEQGYTPSFPGLDDYKGILVHPQFWPEALDYSGKQVVVIGSGATAVTLIPAMAEKVAHLTLLQRSPSYIISRDNKSPLAELLGGLELPDDWVHEILRRRSLKDSELIASMARHQPEKLRDDLIHAVRAQLPEVDVETHFTPRYMPWKERLCLVPDNDLFKAIRGGNISIVTDEIETFTEAGIRLKTGQELEADIIVSATGLQLCPLGNIEFVVDGTEVDITKTWTYKGILYSDIPNMAWTFGYIRTSWTMRSDLISEFVCRLLHHMDQKGVRQCTPRLRPEDDGMKARRFIDEADFSPGYMARSMASFPRQGDREPWTNSQDYNIEKDTLPGCELEDGVLTFDNRMQEPAGG